MTRRSSLRTASALLAITLLAAAAPGDCPELARYGPYTGPPRPNLVFLLADQWSGHQLALMGDPNLFDPDTGESLTPNFDALANEGVQFRRCITANPVCCPNRMALLTGRFPHRDGGTRNRRMLRRDAESYAEVLRDVGYATGYIGKWHVNIGLQSEEALPGGFVAPGGNRRHGFDSFAGSNALHNYYDSVYYLDAPVPLRPQPPDTYEPVYQLEFAKSFISRYANDRPFLLTLSVGPPHTPHNEEDVPPEYWARIDPDRLVPRPNVPSFDEPDLWISGHPCPDYIPDIEDCWRHYMRGFYAQILQLDDLLGELRAFLAAEGIADDTVIVFSSDHGERAGSHGLYFKTSPHMESVHVPLVIHWPTGTHLDPEERIVDEWTSSLDIPATLAGLGGGTFSEAIEGRDLTPWLVQGAPWPTPPGGYVFAEGSVVNRVESWRSVQRDDYTLWLDATTNIVNALYDLAVDPYQLDNLAGRGLAIEDELASAVREWRYGPNGESRPWPGYPSHTQRDLTPGRWSIVPPTREPTLSWMPAVDATGRLLRRYRIVIGDEVPAAGEAWDHTFSAIEPEYTYEGIVFPLPEGVIDYGKRYYWRVDAIDPNSTTPNLSSPIAWFETAPHTNLATDLTHNPESPREPFPADGATDVATFERLTWESCHGAREYRISFGTTSPPPVWSTQAELAACPTLDPGTTYYWRIDPIGSGGITSGAEWSFTTAP